MTSAIVILEILFIAETRKRKLILCHQTHVIQNVVLQASQSNGFSILKLHQILKLCHSLVYFLFESWLSRQFRKYNWLQTVKTE